MGLQIVVGFLGVFRLCLVSTRGGESDGFIFVRDCLLHLLITNDS